MTVLGTCPACDRLVNIVVKRHDMFGRVVWRTLTHGSCPGGEIR
jgi:hypothetical protein